MNWIRTHRKSLVIGVVAVLLLFVLLWERCGLRGCPNTDKLRGYMKEEAPTILDYQGREVGKLYLTRHAMVPLDSLPEYVPQAFVAQEDKRFYDHHGVDWKRVGGAFVQNVKSMGIEEGSSTITMQLARNVFPDRLPANKRTLWRKFAEAHVAMSIERRYSKHDILELYLNQIYFGGGAYGIEAAAQEYFGKPARKLALSEAATLSAAVRAPSRINPRSNKRLALEGRKMVLQRMVEQNFITAEQAEQSGKVKLKLRHGTQRASTLAPYFVEAIRDQLEEQLGDDIYSKGYVIYTTLDAQLQTTLEQELLRQMNAIESGAYGTYRHTTFAVARADTSNDEESGTSYLQAAAVFMDTHTGDVRALIGGRNFDDSEYNRALYAERQPGSAFKPFVYAAAFAQGYAPTYRLVDKPIRMVLSRNKVWEPKNYDGGYAGVVSLRDALAFSKNVPTVRLATEIGIDRVIDMAQQMGLKGRIPSVPSVVLGTADVTPLDLTTTFAAFATLGERPTTARLVTKVVDQDGKTVWSQETSSTQVIDPTVAFMTVSLMQDVVDRGTAATVRAVGYHEQAAGKTGTTQDAADIWFVGFTPRLIGTIWMGFDKRQTIIPRATGGELAAPVWGRVMSRMHVRSEGWVPPAGIEMQMVDEAGNVVGQNCVIMGATRREYFIRGTAPVQNCYPAYDQYSWNDTLGYAADTLAYAGESQASWWARMRRRMFGSSTDTSRLNLDTATSNYPTEQVNPTPNTNPNALPPPKEKPKPPPVPYDSLVKRDSLPKPKRDTLQDTLSLR
jgi:penicillin-binding protein 1A